jgi:hypothetical protein
MMPGPRSVNIHCRDQYCEPISHTFAGSSCRRLLRGGFQSLSSWSTVIYRDLTILAEAEECTAAVPRFR